MRHTGHIRQRSKGSYEIRFNLGVDLITGKRKTITTTFNGTYDEAKKELRKLLRTIDTNEYVPSSKIKVKDFLKQWLETVRAQVSPATHERYSDTVSLFLTPIFGDTLLNKLQPSEIQKTYNGWEIGGRRDGGKGGLAPRTRIVIHRILKSALKHALQLQLIARNPADAVIPPKAKKVAITVLNIEQSATLLDAVRDSRLYRPVLLALTTGMRRGEILALRWKNVDLDKATVRVVESVERTRSGLRFKSPKTDKTRAVILPDYAVEELRAWKNAQMSELSEQRLKQTQETLVCSRRDGEVLNPTTVTHEFIAAINKLPGLPRVRFHDLRHSHATQLLTSGIHPKIAQERLGHSTITTTMDLYSHVTPTMQGEAASKLDTALRSAIKSKPNRGPQLG